MGTIRAGDRPGAVRGLAVAGAGPRQPRALPLTFFDLVFWDFPPVQRVLFYGSADQDFLDVPGFLRRDLPLFKASLAAALHRFYPLAGRLPCELPAQPEVACSDGDSVRLTVAVSGDDFSDLAGDHPRDTARLRALLPLLPSRGEGTRGVFAVQVTVFPRAGIFVGTTLHHAVADDSSYVHFVRTWAAIHRRLVGADKKVVDVAVPLFDRGVVRDDAGLREAFVRDHLAAGDDGRLDYWDLTRRPGGGGVVLATFRFTEELLARLGKRLESETSARRCSPYALACGAAWAGIVHARGGDGINCNARHQFGFVTGCKPRASPPVPGRLRGTRSGAARRAAPTPGNYFGNCLGLCRVEEDDHDDRGLTASAAIWHAIEELAEQGRALRDARGWVRLVRESAAARAVTVAGSPKLGIYAAADLGAPWGRPRKVEIVSVERTGALALAENLDGGGGIEVGVALPRGEMEAFRAFYGDLVAGLR
ncbi:anthocyanidin 5-O-glucoside-6''-O-malonyltransferase-like [Hordeum vulgare]|nr:anthocyanidin 5-O-glucoside-6''-O-malonyltransferase-like [Hordeum vulgare]